MRYEALIAAISPEEFFFDVGQHGHRRVVG
jgi:hypothetical protein